MHPRYFLTMNPDYPDPPNGDIQTMKDIKIESEPVKMSQLRPCSDWESHTEDFSER